jgi:hypothetical protein
LKNLKKNLSLKKFISLSLSLITINLFAQPWQNNPCNDLACSTPNPFSWCCTAAPINVDWFTLIIIVVYGLILFYFYKKTSNKNE